MSRPNWRDPAEYESLRSVDTPTLAGEFLKRNPDYFADHERLDRLAAEGRLSADEVDAFAADWGVRFRRKQRISQLDGASASHGNRRRDYAAGACWSAAPG